MYAETVAVEAGDGELSVYGDAAPLGGGEAPVQRPADRRERFHARPIQHAV